MHRNVPIDRLADVLNSERGLQQEEATARLKQYGHNDIAEASTSTWLTLLYDTARDPMLWFLLGTSILFIFLGDKIEALVMLAAVIPFVGMDMYLHRRTQASTEGLKSRLATVAQVVRNNEVTEISATDIVPGDLVVLSAGQYIPADGVLIKSDSVQLDESALTGESYPVRKQSIGMLESRLTEEPVDASHWAYAGTRILTGSANLRIVFTGVETLYGEIVRSSVAGQRERTPLQSAIANLVGILLIAATILCLVLAWVRLRQGFGIVDALLSAVTLAVAALPEEFPVVFTFFLGVGVYRLARRHALVRRAVVVENIGRISCICSDKTGTITEGQLHLAHHFPNRDTSEQQLLAIAASASRTETGDPLDLAIFRLAPSAESNVSTLATFPFTEDRKRETVVFREPDGLLVAATKGAPETVLSMCTLSSDEFKHWNEKVTDLAASGHKVIACAQHNMEEQTWAGGEPDRAFNFLGLLAFEDPVREGVRESIQQCRASGIHIVMVTGDHPLTATAVARETGIGGDSPNVVEASQLETLLRRNPDTIKNVDVIARAVPSQKLNIVKSLQSVGEVVAVTGDGVNDVPALQAADIGLAMGERGTRSAREAAAIVLLDDNFRTITHAIAEGRQLFQNLKLSFAYLLMIHIPLVLTAAFIPLVGYPLLYFPIHIVWLELIIHPTALLVFQELPASDHLEPVRRTRRLQFFNPREWAIIAGTGMLITLMIIIGYEHTLGVGREVEHARAMTLMTLSFSSAMVTVVLSRLASRTSRTVTILTILVSLALTQTPPLAKLLHLTPLHIDDLLLCIVGATVVAFLVALGKFGYQKKV